MGFSITPDPEHRSFGHISYLSWENEPQVSYQVIKTEFLKSGRSLYTSQYLWWGSECLDHGLASRRVPTPVNQCHTAMLRRIVITTTTAVIHMITTSIQHKEHKIHRAVLQHQSVQDSVTRYQYKLFDRCNTWWYNNIWMGTYVYEVRASTNDQKIDKRDLTITCGNEEGAWQTPWNCYTPNCIKLLCCCRLFYFCCVPALVLGSSAQKPWIVAGWAWVGGWLGCYWVRTTATPTTNISLTGANGNGMYKLFLAAQL